ncbi:MAG TPA: aminoacyl-tRNA hydrolase [Polyangiaceae bacterium]|nr:aminoacyl-tRNA hydrolase [Polyangiaceae bacterium]
MFLVVGLGNPGREHEANRHNVGFVVADELRRAEGWPEFKPKFSGVWTRGQLEGQEVALLKPQTYMNLSGASVQPAAAFFKVPPEQIIVVHDELDLPWREVRLKVGGGHAGNNGVRSIIQTLSTPEFLRVRVGIGKPPAGFRGEGADWVLSNFDAVERAELPEVVTRAVDAIRRVAQTGPAAAMNFVNTRGKNP